VRPQLLRPREEISDQCAQPCEPLIGTGDFRLLARRW
jgi:hypothetical protein